MPTADESEERLRRALAAYDSFDAGGRADADEFLAEHADLADLLTPMLSSTDDRASRASDRRDAAGEHLTLGDYDLTREVGRGAMGVVYEAIQRSLGRRVAVKRLQDVAFASGNTVARFDREARMAAKLRHPGIAAVHEFAVVDDERLLVMEFVDGAPLDALLERLRAGADHPPREAAALWAALRASRDGEEIADAPPASWGRGHVDAVVELVRQIARALGQAHRNAIVHRDVKPGNVMITGEGRAVLTDFGLAREVGIPALTRSGDFAGTPHYSPPEQLAGDRSRIGPASDVFALGVMLYEMLTLVRPFDGRSLHELQRRIERDEPPSPRRANPAVSADLAAVVAKSLEKAPARRYANGSELADDLERIADGRPVAARRVSATRRAMRWSARNRLASALIATLVSGVAVSAGLGVLAAREARAKGQALDRFELLRLGAELQRVTASEREAHPAWPATAGVLAQLVTAGETRLVPAIDDLRRAQDELAGGAAVQLDTAASGSPMTTRAPHPAAVELAEIDARLLRVAIELRDPELPDAARRSGEAEIETLEQRRARLRERIARWSRPDAARAADPLLYDQLEHELHALRRFRDEILPDLRRRLDWSRTVRTRSCDAHAESWGAALARVRRDPRFAGVELVPQTGLVPLGPDPETELEEFAHLWSARDGTAIPSRDGDGALQVGPEHGIVFVLVPGRDGAEHAAGLEGVRLDALFAAKHELSRAQWERLAGGRTGLRLVDGGILDLRNMHEQSKPGNGVSWIMCADLLRRAGLDLPSEAQWHWLATGAGQHIDATTANLADESFGRAVGSRVRLVPGDDGFPGLAPVWSMAPTGFGLHHLFGNVSEWCRDSYILGFDGYRKGDGKPASAGTGRVEPRCVRGGAFNTHIPDRRDRHSAMTAQRDIGVRPVRAVRLR